MALDKEKDFLRYHCRFLLLFHLLSLLNSFMNQERTLLVIHLDQLEEDVHLLQLKIQAQVKLLLLINLILKLF